MPDVNFDPLVERFTKNIYGSTKGNIREHILFSQLESHLSQENNKGRCADIGGGLGQVTHWLLRRGYAVDYFDLSEKMTVIAKQKLAPEHCARARFVHGPFQTTLSDQYDFIHCQALLEWLEDPYLGIQHICAHLKVNGSLMLLFYNINAIVLRNLIRGNIRAAFSGSKGDGTGLTPINPLRIEEVIDRLKHCGFSIEKQFGVRCFTDFQDKNTTQRLPLSALMEAEQRLCEEEPWRSIARYVGVIARRAAD